MLAFLAISVGIFNLLHQRKWRFRALNWWSSFRVIFSLALQLPPFQHKRRLVSSSCYFRDGEFHLSSSFHSWSGCCVIIQTSLGSDFKCASLLITDHSGSLWADGLLSMGIPGGELLPLQSTGERIILFVGKNSQGLSLAPALLPPPTHTVLRTWKPHGVCVLCVSCCRWPVSWSSLRVTWSVQRSGLSFQKGKRARRQEALCGVLRSSD